MRRRRTRPRPLPLRDGVDPVRVRLPAAGTPAAGTVRGRLLARRIRLAHPVTGEPLVLESRRSLRDGTGG